MGGVPDEYRYLQYPYPLTQFEIRSVSKFSLEYPGERKKLSFAIAGRNNVGQPMADRVLLMKLCSLHLGIIDHQAQS